MFPGSDFQVLKTLNVLAICLLTICCQQFFGKVQASNPHPTAVESYRPPKRIGTVASRYVIESSGLVASRTQPGFYWTHNDSGDGPFLYAFDSSGNSRGVWRVTGADARDWEDIASGPGPKSGKSYLYIGDIGDNDSVRSEIVVYRVVEPAIKPRDKLSSKKRPVPTEPAEVFRFRYPDGKHDAEALMVHPVTGNLYIVTKIPFANASVYETPAPLASGKLISMRRLGELRVPSLFGGVITAGDISPDGRRVMLCDYFQGYELVLPQPKSDFDEIWKERLTAVNLGERRQGEAIAYRLDGQAVLATSEGRESPLIEVRRR